MEELREIIIDDTTMSIIVLLMMVSVPVFVIFICRDVIFPDRFGRKRELEDSATSTSA